jgi:hypothetical protein
VHPTPAGQGVTWRDAYQPPARQLTIVHEGGPADGVTVTVHASQLPQARFYAPAQARRRRAVQLARYVRYRASEIDVIVFQYSGLDDRPGPVPGKRESPAWSW